MAEEIQIQGTESTAKVRDVIAVPVLAIVTLGIYFWVWYYKVNRELADYGKAHGKTDELGESPGMSLLAVTLGAFIIVPPFVSIFRAFKRVQALQRITGSGEPINGWLGLVLFLVFSPALWGYMQSGLNTGWQAQAAPAAAAATPTEPTPPGSTA